MPSTFLSAAPLSCSSAYSVPRSVISIEASKSDLKLLEVFKTHNYPNAIGPGLYDIHSPRVPSVDEMEKKIAGLLEAIPQAKDIVCNPDCGLVRPSPSSLLCLDQFLTPRSPRKPVLGPRPSPRSRTSSPPPSGLARSTPSKHL